MNPDQKEILRDCLLLCLAEARGTLMTLAYLHQSAQHHGNNVGADEVRNELTYLADKELVRAEKSVLSAAVTRYRITAQGRDYLEGKGLA